MGNRFVIQGLTGEATHGTRHEMMIFGRLERGGGQTKLSYTIEQVETKSPKFTESHNIMRI